MKKKLELNENDLEKVNGGTGNCYNRASQDRAEEFNRMIQQGGGGTGDSFNRPYANEPCKNDEKDLNYPVANQSAGGPGTGGRGGNPGGGHNNAGNTTNSLN